MVRNPPALFSRNGVLAVNFSYQTTTDPDGRTLFCFMTPDGMENPTLHLNPGDNLIIKATNNTPAAPVEMHIDPPNCGGAVMTDSSVNIHYHGTNTSPACHQDDVLHTVINSGQTFTYDVHVPWDEPPGLYCVSPAHPRARRGGIVRGWLRGDRREGSSEFSARGGGHAWIPFQVPFWDGNPKHPFPSVTVRMDFRGLDIGDFVYHCHIAAHEDDGMMAIVRVTRALVSTKSAGSRNAAEFVQRN